MSGLEGLPLKFQNWLFLRRRSRMFALVFHKLLSVHAKEVNEKLVFRLLILFGADIE